MTDQNETTETSTEGTATPIKVKRKYTKKASKKVAVKKTVKKAKKATQKVKVLGKRYSESEKQRILTFIKNNPQRGSLSKAVKEFGVTFLTLKAWIKKEGVQRPDDQ